MTENKKINTALVNIEIDQKDKELKYYPKHELVTNWQFPDTDLEEAELIHVLAKLSVKTGLSINQLQHIFPAILRMMKSNSIWAK